MSIQIELNLILNYSDFIDCVDCINYQRYNYCFSLDNYNLLIRVSDKDCNFINFKNFVYQDINMNLHLVINCDTYFILNFKMDLVVVFHYYYCIDQGFVRFY